MWNRYKSTVWIHYSDDIIASDEPSANFLADYKRFVTLNRSYANAMEIMDLQRYKVITEPRKVRSFMREYNDASFVFLICKN
ncbi:MAG: hypothetical protein H6551_02035 [Chitinophagales bacterium]|nr:hypothetical protein [Chitinophagaceae bacterium]MCB9063903.1 hypothetical protein [Chitinophagales bacterium]